MSDEFTAGWTIKRSDNRRPVPIGVHPLLDHLGDPTHLERKLLIQTPLIVLDPHGRCEPWIIKWAKTFGATQQKTYETYCQSLLTFLNYLLAVGIRWHDVTTEDFDDYRDWRCSSPDNPARIASGTFSRERSGIKSFYAFVQERGGVLRNPISGKADATSSSSDVKWLTGSAYSRWRDIGVRGYLLTGERDRSWSGRNANRNHAYVEAMYRAGLRNQELSSLLDIEIPTASGMNRRTFHHGRVHEGIAKYGAYSFYMPSAPLQLIDTYRRTERADAVRRARAEGRYDQVENRCVVTSVNLNGKVVWTDRFGQSSEPFKTLTPDIRRRLYQETPDGLEPMLLWLTEGGLPAAERTWGSMFLRASDRCARLGWAVGKCSPHMLRHSFALKLLCVAERAYKKNYRDHLTEDELRDLRLVFGDAYDLVRHLLGHKSRETTEQRYLEPVTGLRVEMLLDSEDESDRMLAVIAKHSPRVLDVEEEEATA